MYVAICIRQLTEIKYNKKTNGVFCRISHIRRWCHWNRRHMAVMMLVSLPADHGRIYLQAFMSKIIYHMLWRMHRALEKACRHVNKTKHNYLHSRFVCYATPNTRHSQIRRKANESPSEMKPINVIDGQTFIPRIHCASHTHDTHPHIKRIFTSFLYQTAYITLYNTYVIA